MAVGVRDIKRDFPSISKIGMFSINETPDITPTGARITGVTGNMILAKFEKEFDDQSKERDSANATFREQV